MGPNVARDGESMPTLVILLHAYTHQASNLKPIENALLREWPTAEVYCPDLPASFLSMATPNSIVAMLLNAIDERIVSAEKKQVPYQEIILVGHSLGALLVRKLYIVACGEIEGAPFEHEYRKDASSPDLIPERRWACLVTRIVLMAGMNRGWRVSHHLSLTHAPLWAIGSGICHIIHFFTGRWPLIFHIRRGAEFITQLRIQWLRMRFRARSPKSPEVRESSLCPGTALTIQLLGSQDDMVAPEDNVDLVSGGDFVYLDVPYSGHTNVIELDDVAYGPMRAKLFARALLGTRDDLLRESVVPSDEKFSAPNFQVKQMVFVIHGIRDVGYWTHKVARRVREKSAHSLNEWATETSSYGYFPMLPFFFPWYRRQKVEWLMDQYTEALARYPNATFSYVGHSNGTYLLAKALELYPCCYVNHVVFAGSVVRCHYNWKKFFLSKPPQVKAVLNFVATRDWVVAFFPKVFQQLRLQDLGSAGHDGFSITQPSSQFYEVTVKGGHSAAIHEQLWGVIAEFIITGKPGTTMPSKKETQSPWVVVFGLFPPFIWAAILLVGYGIWLGIMCAISAAINDPSFEAQATGFALASYLLFLWLVLTRI